MVSEEELAKILAEEKAIEPADAEAIKSSSSSLQAIFMKSDNVHTHTANIGKVCRESLLPMDDKYDLHVRTSVDVETTVAEILDYCDNDAKVKTVLDSILASPGIEAETGLELQNTLIRVWSITKHNALAVDHKGLIIDALRHNIEAGGGCLAGISARLVAPYSLLLNQILQNLILFQQRGMLPPIPRTAVAGFDGLEQALALSRSEYESMGGEDAAFLMAQRLSLRDKDGSVDPVEERIATYMSMGLGYDDAVAAVSAEFDDGTGSLNPSAKLG